MGRACTVSSNRRKREYERRRYEAWQRKLSDRQARRRRTQRNGLAVGAALAVVAVIFGVIYLLNGSGSSSTPTAAASASPGASASPDASASASESAAADPNNPCPAPTVKPPAKPLSFKAAPDPATAQAKTWKVTLTTSCGPIVLSLDGAKAPKAVASTLLLARSKFYDGTPCHRLTTTGIFVLQCGDPTGTGTGGPGYEYGPVENAPASNVYPVGTLAMARQGSNGNSNGSQFFIVYKESTIPSDSAGGYTVMGTVVSGMDIVQKIADGGLAADGTAPKRPISILSSSVAPG
jgi:peptidyl-prolyl cis-trans isomerase B (cyclophilin B)